MSERRAISLEIFKKQLLWFCRQSDDSADNFLHHSRSNFFRKLISERSPFCVCVNQMNILLKIYVSSGRKSSEFNSLKNF